MKTFNSVLGGILNIIHPHLYDIGQAAFALLRDPGDAPEPWFSYGEYPRLARVLEEWTHPFSAISVMVNRSTPCHRDVNGRNPWLDILVTIGEYELGRLELPGLGVRLEYDPGTIVGILGKVVRHGACEVQGERVCLAYYMRDKVHERLGLPAGPWMKVSHYNIADV